MLRRLAFVLLLAWVQAPAADEAAEAAARLERLKARIGQVQQRLAEARRKESRLSEELRRAETRIAATSRALRDVGREIGRHDRRLKALRQERSAQAGLLARARARLKEQVRAAYILGREEQFKMLLSQEDPHSVGRTLVYYRYLNRARAEQIREVREALARLARLEEDIAGERAALEAARAEQREHLARLEDERAERARLLKRIRAEIRGGDRELSRLSRDRARLEVLLEELQHALADLEDLDAGRRPFGELRKRLPWPVAGRLAARYGERREAGGLRWRGVFIEAPANREVRAISHGRVAFADWLRGFGLLVIVDHGDGYMSLYGHNQAIYKEVGDWVEAGEVIAAVGDSGGMERSGLYFELRHRGKPINPLKWCKGRPTAGRAG